ncbi:MAG: DNA mismatch endonuclease Vsr [Candidatus Saganbacteria bacterium]|nr:DNA mismatch endonuclease Vsr [Candidatus Saganbacteria bacterium]
MACIRSKDTQPERIVRSFLRKLGFRFSLHRKNLPGHPDIVLSKYKTVVFVNGCFWHSHTKCNEGKTPASNRSYWKKKLLGNVIRQKENIRKLRRLGWQVFVVWECEIERNTSKTLNKVLKKLI